MISSISVEQKSDGTSLFNDILKDRMNTTQISDVSMDFGIPAPAFPFEKKIWKEQGENVNFHKFEKQTEDIYSIMQIWDEHFYSLI